ncbi:MAG TPA: CsbD family protein [Streptosporangiaceae bacterium]
MSNRDKARNFAQALKGRARKTAGKATGNRSAQAAGTAEKTKANLKQAGEKLKDAIRK